MILLDEWSFFLKNCEIAADTVLGKLLSADQEGGVGKKEALFASKMSPAANKTAPAKKEAPPVWQLLEDAKKKKDSTSSWVAKPVEKKSPKTFLKRGSSVAASKEPSGPVKSAEELQAELKEWLQTKPPFQSAATPNSFGLAVGKSASDELRNFISVFEPLAAESSDGERLRDEGFLVADPNGVQ